MSSTPDASPLNPLPPVIVALTLLVFGIELIFNFGNSGWIGGPEAVGWRLAAIQTYSFSAIVFDWMLANGIYPPEHVMRFVTYPFVHANFTHMLFVAVFLLALGKKVSEVFSAAAVLLIFFASAIVGALAYGLLLDTPVPLIGGYPAVYGLIGAYTFLLWVNLAVIGASRYRAFTLIGFLLGIQLVFGLLLGGGQDWVADFGGFATGFGLSFVVCPGGWARVRNIIRRD